MVDAVAEDVQVLTGRVNRGQLGGRHDAHAELGAGAERLVDAGGRVVVGQGEQPHAGERREAHDLGRGELAVGVARV